MARVTIEDCLPMVENRFQLVLVAARRARQLATGYEPRVESANDKPTVIALREISAGLTTADILNENSLSNLLDPIMETGMAAENSDPPPTSS